MSMDHWVFVFHRWRDLREQPVGGWYAFRDILDSVRPHLVETTPGTAFETFPRAVPGYNVHMVRFRWSPEDGPPPSHAWTEAGIPWLLLGTRTPRQAPVTLARSRVDAALDAEFRYWLRNHLHVLHEPLE